MPGAMHVACASWRVEKGVKALWEEDAHGEGLNKQYLWNWR